MNKNESPGIPTRRDLLMKVLGKLLNPPDLIRYAEFKLVSGNEYPYFDFVNMFPWLAPTINRCVPRRVAIDDPFFIAGLRRSGSTLFYRIMNANTRIFLFNERFPGDRMNGRGVASSSNIYSIDDPDAFRKIALRYLGPGLRSRYTRWGAKLSLELAHTHPGSISHTAMDRIVAAFPRARIIGLTRDPRDFVLSALKRGGRDVQWWIDEYREMVHLFDRLRESMHSKFMIVKYEDLLDDPVAIVRCCCDFADLDFEDGMLDTSKWSVKGPKEYASQRIDSRHDKWREATGGDREIVNRVASEIFPLAAKYGYPMD